MIEELNRSVHAIEDLKIDVPYLAITVGINGATIQMNSADFDKIREEVDPCRIVRLPFGDHFFRVERTMMIGTVRVFALYEV